VKKRNKARDKKNQYYCVKTQQSTINQNTNLTMDSKTVKTILFFTFLCLAALFLVLWLVDYSGFGIPEMIPELNYRTYGIMILVAFSLLLFLLQRRLFKLNPAIPLSILLVAPAIVSFISVLIYQVIRQLMIVGNSFSDKASMIMLSSIIPAILFTILSATYALKLKKIEGVWSRIPLLLLIAAVLLVKRYGTGLEW
jgi:hypothetical protein